MEPVNEASLRTAAAAGYVREALVRDQELRGRPTDLVRLAVSRPRERR